MTKTGPNRELTLDPVGDANRQLTEPGAKLKVGESATVDAEEFTKGEKYWARAILKVTVTAIRKGDPADLDALPDNKQQPGATPWYIDTNTEIIFWEGSIFASPFPFIVGTPSHVTEVTSGMMNSMLPLITPKGFAKCDRQPRPKIAPGAIHKECFMVVSKEAGEVNAAFLGNYKKGSRYRENGITWRA